MDETVHLYVLIKREVVVCYRESLFFEKRHRHHLTEAHLLMSCIHCFAHQATSQYPIQS